MLVKYEMGEGSSKYERFYRDRVAEIISPSNDDFTEIIRDIMINYMKMGHFDCEVVIDDIRVINSKISEEIAQVAIDEGIAIGHWDDDDDFFQFLVETADDIIDTVFFSQDIMIEIQRMIYETAKKYDLPIMMKKGMFFEFPEILEMYCPKGNKINALPDNKEVFVHSNHSQLVMFEEFMDNEPSFYGRNNILIYEEKEIGNRANLLEG